VPEWTWGGGRGRVKAVTIGKEKNDRKGTREKKRGKRYTGNNEENEREKIGKLSSLAIRDGI
jgi:hypothetical protein